MLLTYVFVLISLFVIFRSFIELIQLLVYGDIPKKKLMATYFNQLQGNQKKKFRISSLLKGNSQLGESYMKMSTWKVVAVCLACMLIGYVFFQNIFFSLISGGIGLLYPRVVFNRQREKLKKVFILQFRDAMISISNSLKAGSSLQTAFNRCYTDLQKQFKKEKLTPILTEFEKINTDFQFGVPVEEALQKFKERNPYEEVQQFIDGTLITKSKGGNLTEVIGNITEMITDKITIQQEIELATAQKKMEARILTFFPIVLVLMIMVLNPAYLQPMYESWLGTTLLFLASIMLIINYFLAKAITTIEI